MNSQTQIQEDQWLTQANFVDIIISVLGIQDQIPDQASQSFKAAFLKSLGYAPLDGWQLENILTKGEAAVVIIQLIKTLDFQIDAEAGEEWYVKKLADLEIFENSGGAENYISISELVYAINRAADIEGTGLQPYQDPISPVTG
jgi:hypothetical protein